MNYEEMSDFEINKCVAEAAGMELSSDHSGAYVGVVRRSIGSRPNYGHVNYCNNPSDAWTIIVKNKIRISPVMHMSDDNGEYICNGMWEAGTLWGDDGAFYNSKYNEASNENPLRAAMIVFLMMQGQSK